MYKRFLWIALLIIPLLPLHAQYKTYLGIQAGPAWDLLRVDDPGNYFLRARLKGTVYGLSLRQEVLNQLYVETGLYYSETQTGLNLDDNRLLQPAWPVYRTFLVPVKAGFRIQPSSTPIGITPSAGYQLGLIRGNTGTPGNASTVSIPGDRTLSYTAEVIPEPASAAHALTLGLMFDYRFENNWLVALSFAHQAGFSRLYETRITYTGEDGNQREAAYTGEGSRFYTTLGLQVPVSNIWHNRDARIRASIEQSRGAGKTVTRNRAIYIGGEFGGRWRRFTTNQAAVGARPMSGRGLFGYAVMHTGGYAGYRFNSRVGADLGVYYQRSRHYLTLMYDHETDYHHRVRTPFFMEFPVRVRYFHDAWKNRLHVVPFTGISILTHFSPAGVQSSGGSFTYTDLSGTSQDATFDYEVLRETRLGVLLKAGVGAEYRLPFRFPLVATLYLTYNHGISEVERTDLTTSPDEQPAVSNLTYRGTGWNLAAGIKVPFELGKSRNCGAEQRTR